MEKDRDQLTPDDPEDWAKLQRSRGQGTGGTGYDRLPGEATPRGGDGAPESHGVHGTQREDGEMQEEPGGTEGADAEDWAEKTQTGGDAT